MFTSQKYFSSVARRAASSTPEDFNISYIISNRSLIYRDADIAAIKNIARP
jgi:hypothetical protein